MLTFETGGWYLAFLVLSDLIVYSIMFKSGFGDCFIKSITVLLLNAGIILIAAYVFYFAWFFLSSIWSLAVIGLMTAAFLAIFQRMGMPVWHNVPAVLAIMAVTAALYFIPYAHYENILLLILLSFLVIAGFFASLILLKGIGYSIVVKYPDRLRVFLISNLVLTIFSIPMLIKHCPNPYWQFSDKTELMILESLERGSDTNGILNLLRIRQASVPYLLGISSDSTSQSENACIEVNILQQIYPERHEDWKISHDELSEKIDTGITIIDYAAANPDLSSNFYDWFNWMREYLNFTNLFLDAIEDGDFSEAQDVYRRWLEWGNANRYPDQSNYEFRSSTHLNAKFPASPEWVAERILESYGIEDFGL